jgi:hypothetical protein
MIIAIAVLVVAGLLAFVASRPSKFRIERSAHISAPSQTVFALLNDFHESGKWSDLGAALDGFIAP